MICISKLVCQRAVPFLDHYSTMYTLAGSCLTFSLPSPQANSHDCAFSTVINATTAEGACSKNSDDSVEGSHSLYGLL